MDSKSERAYQQREALEYKEIEPWAKQIGESFVKGERHKNFFRNAQEFPAVADVTTVRVMPTADGGFTVSLIDVDGKVCTFWMVGSLPALKPARSDGVLEGYLSSDVTFPVRSITSY